MENNLIFRSHSINFFFIQTPPNSDDRNSENGTYEKRPSVLSPHLQNAFFSENEQTNTAFPTQVDEPPPVPPVAPPAEEVDAVLTQKALGIVVNTPNSYGTVVHLLACKHREQHPKFDQKNIFSNKQNKYANRWSQLKHVYRYINEIENEYYIDTEAAAIRADAVRTTKGLTMSQFVKWLRDEHFALGGKRQTKKQKLSETQTTSTT